MDHTDGSLERAPVDTDRGFPVDGEHEHTPSEDVRSEIPRIQDLMGRDLSRLAEILPEETRTHLKRAGTEAGLALYHLWRHIEASTKPAQEPKVRRRIDVE